MSQGLQHRKLLRGAERRLNDYVVGPVRQRAHHVSYAMRMLFLAPILTAVAIFSLLAFVPQLHEVYRGIIDERQYGNGFLGLAMLFLLSAQLFWWNAGLNTTKINLLYLSHADLGIDRTLGAFRDFKGLFCAAAPLAGLGVGLVILHERSQEDSQQFAAVLEQLRLAGGLTNEKAEDLVASLWRDLSVMRDLPGGVLAAAIAVAVSSLVFMGVLLRLRANPAVRQWVIRCGYGLGAVMILLPILDPTGTAAHYAGLPGPLALIGMVLIAATALVIGLTTISQFTRFPVITVLLILGVLFAYWNITGSVAPDRGSDSGNEGLHRGNTELTQSFQYWLAARRDLETYRGRPYPVFIFSVQGGGIYAASEGASYLSRLSDRCNAFDHHVFAISAVSGGAIGATIFDGLVFDDKGLYGPLDCTGEPGGEMAAKAHRVVRADHLSPVVAFLLPDLLRKVVPFGAGGDDKDRAAALSTSFSRAYAAAVPPRIAGQQPALNRRFDDYWNVRASPPALLLNATSVESGHRVAFAPFKLREASDGTLFSMTEVDTRRPKSLLPTARLSMIDAAVISARIPGVIPTWRFARGTKHWNFVDGGYADGSGASTALDVFRAIARVYGDPDRRPPLPGGISDIDLRLVMLTDSGAAPRFDDLEGDGFSEAVVTLTTLLNVRKLLSSRAVTQADTEVERLSTELGKPTDGRGALIVRLEHGTFPLSLGWKISRTTDSIVQLLLGDPRLCPPGHDSTMKSGSETDRAVAAVNNNSCVTRQILDLLKQPAG